MKRTSKAVIYVSIVVAVIYIFLVPVASNGYGYAQFDTTYHGPSAWYFNDTSYYYEKSTRNGSLSGTNTRGGGPGHGK